MLYFKTAGESHGKCLVAMIEGFPSGVFIDEAVINKEMKRRQGGLGRGGRMQIEEDRVEILSGIRKNITLGSPICLMIKNSDYKIDELPAVTRPRPGHADLAGVLKYNLKDARNILERASARETAARVAVGAVAKILLSLFGIGIFGYVKGIGGIHSDKFLKDIDVAEKIREKSSVYCIDQDIEGKIIEKIQQTAEKGDSLGGVVEVIAYGLPVGLGSHTQWDLRLDARLAGALMSVQAIKGVELGLGCNVANRFGSEVHDEIFYEKPKQGKSVTGGFKRMTNNAGGIEGGISNGEPIIVRAYMKPIPTLKKPLRSVDLLTKEPITATYERSDVCAVPAASVVCESMIAFEIARAFLEKFGKDSIDEVKRNFEGYLSGF
ncbi:MAG: chorismate synthase [Candidatus Brocadia sp. AMX2]|uniref:Chorismate synthase n=1 Tax=Candidatus Brocadia sinica JPN1 TaxID=1197129 RepID=A0ABQ0JY78_9BACT|nr:MULTISPECIES: chorismate synthase [Brocadia]MBC6931382.1 chorismate synthase [Candidatus Brocadia sp.]MBL1167562.1 chorismate synthase [Candidatus Brocadia sp. AMX1]NOG40546.1 chorismate synthase [Planctomycetota bacterium]GIK13479.1 MAG: chorismate synthase [Candidatus Brocadia sinica]KAA0244113.1 MAG: chorismate synthase [Candidatus Brocadia sp. AMX2]